MAATLLLLLASYRCHLCVVTADVTVVTAARSMITNNSSNSYNSTYFSTSPFSNSLPSYYSDIDDQFVKAESLLNDSQLPQPIIHRSKAKSYSDLIITNTLQESSTIPFREPNHIKLHRQQSSADLISESKSSLNLQSEKSFQTKKMKKWKKHSRTFHLKKQNTPTKKIKHCNMSTDEFIIMNDLSGKYIYPNKQPDFSDGQLLVLWEGHNNQTHYVFEQIDGIWGYIHESTSCKIWYPSGGYNSTKEPGTNITLNSIRKRWALFAIDEVNSYIIHRDGLFVHHWDGRNPYPRNGDNIILHHTVHEGMTWTLVNPENRSEEVYPYGQAQISGDWKIVFAVENPLAKQTWQYKFKLGKSVSASTNESFQFKWEASASARFWFTQMSTSATLKREIKNSLSYTWNEEIEEITSVEVEPGKTVVVWQKIFIGKHLGHTAVFQANYFAHTRSSDDKPSDHTPLIIHTK